MYVFCFVNRRHLVPHETPLFVLSSQSQIESYLKLIKETTAAAEEQWNGRGRALMRPQWR